MVIRRFGYSLALLGLALSACLAAGENDQRGRPEDAANGFVAALANRDCDRAVDFSTIGFWRTETRADAVLTCRGFLDGLPEITAYGDHGALYGEPGSLPDATVLVSLTFDSGATALWIVSLADFPEGWTVVDLSGNSN